MSQTSLVRALEPICETRNIQLLYHFGAQRGETDLSDLDLAVLLDEPTEPTGRLRLIDEFVVATGREDVDLAILNGASDLLRFQVVRSGRLLYQVSESVRVRFETKVLRTWFDAAPKRRERSRLLRLKIESGRFGGR